MTYTIQKRQRKVYDPMKVLLQFSKKLLQFSATIWKARLLTLQNYCKMKTHNPSDKVNVFWFRRDLRLEDNKALYEALSQPEKVLPLFVFDTDILQHLEADDPRIAFIHKQMLLLQNQLSKTGTGIWIFHGRPLDIFRQLIKKWKIQAVFANKDHEPYGIARDQQIADFLKTQDITFHLHLDHLIFDKSDILKNDNTPFQVFTPYSKKWKASLKTENLQCYPSATLWPKKFLDLVPPPTPALHDLGFTSTTVSFPPAEYPTSLLTQYHQTRDYPSLPGTSRLGVHLRFGTISIRKLLREALKITPDNFLNELIWREFYAMILWYHPRVQHQAFKLAYDQISWQNNPDDYERWKTGRTGYPLVDAGMRELSATGFMHNRVRMVVASFLCKHLLIDWRWGEAWFAQKLLDYELSSNNGGWQWSAGTGCDAAPYFRVFNPSQQQKKFDSQWQYIKKWVPEFGTPRYPKPMVDHAQARERCLMVYKQALKGEM